MGVLRVKPGVLFTHIAPAGFVILGALAETVAPLAFDLTITSACDGAHSGPDDPHHTGEAYDVRAHDLTPEQQRVVLGAMALRLGERQFFGFLEAAGTEDVHFHFQRAKGTVYP